MRRTCKKAVALLVALTLMVSMCVSVAAAIDATLVLESNKSTIYENDVFTLTMKINAAGVTGLRNGALYITYPSNVIVPCTSDGTELTTWDDGDTSVMATSVADSHFIASNKVSNADNVGKLSLEILMNNKNSDAIPVTEGSATVLSFWFLAKGIGDATVVLDSEAGETGFIATEDDLTIAYTPTVISVQPVPVAPTATNLKLKDGDALKEGTTVHAAYDWHNGATSGGGVPSEDAGVYGTDDQSEITWYVGGEEVVAAAKAATLTIAKEHVGKEVEFTVLPKTSRDEDRSPVGTLSEKCSVGIAMPDDEYAPLVSEVALSKITLNVETNVAVTYEKVYDAEQAAADSTYAWYVLPEGEYADAAAAVAAFEGLGLGERPEVVATTLNTTFADSALKDRWAVLEITSFEVVNGTEFPTNSANADIDYVAAKIEAKKATAGIQGSASLVTGTTVVPKPEEPGTDEPGTDEPGTDEPGTDEPGTTEPETEDPAGTANEVGAAAFTDVDKEAYAWAYDSIDALAKSGVIKGMTADSFGPELSTTNAQVIALVVRIAGLTAEDATTDHVDEEHWAYEEMAAAQAADILGVFGDAIDVEKATTREVAFTLLYNALKAAGIELEVVAEDIAYTDAASIDANCVEAISALTKAGIINGMGDGTLAPKAEITRAQLAKILGLAPTK